MRKPKRGYLMSKGNKGRKTQLSIVIPARDEAKSLSTTITLLHESLALEKISHEIVVVDDHSSDETTEVVERMATTNRAIALFRNEGPSGFGNAVRLGIARANGEAVAIFMADGSDRPEDLVEFFRTMERTGADAVFGSRFSRRGKAIDYPWHKLILNRFVNSLIRLLFGINYNDVTNAFKLYRRTTLEGVQPLVSHHFNLTVEIPLKTIIRGYKYEIVPNWWINRRQGVSKLRIKEMGSRYLFTILSCLLEKWLSGRDYVRIATENVPRASEPSLPMDNSPLYRFRFRQVPNSAKTGVWKVIAGYFYELASRPESTLDLAAGDCEFINALPSRERWAIDFSSRTQRTAASTVKVVCGDIRKLSLPEKHFDLILASNFFEHLQTAESVQRVLEKCHQFLKPNGTLIVMGPNFKYCFADYYDFSDHKLPLTENSMEELLVQANFRVQRKVAKFLPYSFTGKLPASPFLTSLYLRMPLVWTYFGRQFLIVARPIPAEAKRATSKHQEAA